MLKQIADGVRVHVSEFLDSNAVVVDGPAGPLVVDPGITSSELGSLAAEVGPAVAGFSTHPDWDHVLWPTALGDVPRYGTAANAATIAEFLARPDWRTVIVPFLPPEYVDEIPTDELFGQIAALPAGTGRFPWDGPGIRILEHRAHAAGHAALLLEDSGVLVAGDMLSDTLIPFLDGDAADPVGDYLAALDLFDTVVDEVTLVVPGHGTVGDDIRERLELDRAYLQALRDGRAPDDPRVREGAPHADWLPGVHDWQVQQVLAKG